MLEEPANLEAMEYVDGTLSNVRDRGLTMRPFKPLDGSERVAFEIQEADASYFDIIHLKSHSSIALPTRVYYVREGDRYVARFAEDAPANTSGS